MWIRTLTTCNYTNKNSDTSKKFGLILIGHSNINFFFKKKKIKILVFSIAVNLELLTISETKIDESFPISQFLIPGFENPIFLYQSSCDGGITLYFKF